MNDVVFEPRVGYEWEMFPYSVGNPMPKVMITGRFEPPFLKPERRKAKTLLGGWRYVESWEAFSKCLQDWDWKCHKWADFLEGSAKALIDAEWIDFAEIRFDHREMIVDYMAYWCQTGQRLARRFQLTYEEFHDLERVAEKFKFQMRVLEVAVTDARVFYSGGWKEPFADGTVIGRT